MISYKNKSKVNSADQSGWKNENKISRPECTPTGTTRKQNKS